MQRPTQPPLLDEDLEFVLHETAGLWEALRGQQIFITGATGFFGIWLLETFLAANRRHALNLRLIATSRNPSSFKQRLPHLASANEIRWITGNLVELDLSAIESQLGEPFRCQSVIHLITEGDVQSMKAAPLPGIDAIVGSTRKALDLAAAGGAKRFLFTSSGAVYGRQPAELALIPESYRGIADPTDPSSIYGLSGDAKRQAESLCTSYAEQSHFEVIIARCFTFLGPHLPLDGKFAVGNFLRDALSQTELVIKGDGTPVRSYLYAAELTVWLLHLLVRGGPGEIFNVGSEVPISIRELAEKVSAVSGNSLRVQVHGTVTEGGRVDRYVPSTTRIRSELSLVEKISLSEALTRNLRWLRSKAS